MQIPIVFATDENYIFYTVVAITSLAQNAREDTTYNIYLLVSEKLKSGHWLLGALEECWKNIRITLLVVNDEEYADVRINNLHVTKTAFYRLEIMRFLTEDKCIYLDSDVIVTEDLQCLYSVELGKNYIAGARDIWIDMLDDTTREKRRENTGIKDMDQYVNSGVLLLNLKRLREENMLQQFQKHMRISYLYEDQDILNVCCYNFIMQLPPKWNIFTYFLGSLDELQKHGISKSTIEQLQQQSGIIHYATPFIRPWETSIFVCNDIWWKYAEEWKNTEEYQRIRQNADKNDIGYLWERLVQCCRQPKQVVLFGFTQLARTVYDRLAEEGMREKVIFCDNDVDKQKQEYDGKKVHSFEETKRLKGALYVVMSQQRRKEVVAFLRQNGIEEQQILWYIKKNSMFYQCLRPELCEEGGAGNV